MKNPFLVALCARVRALRSRRGMTRKAVAQALQCSLAELIGDVTTSSPEWLLIRELLERQDEPTLRRVREAVGALLGTGDGRQGAAQRPTRVALIGLRGAGKSTLGRMLADDLGFPFVELSCEIGATHRIFKRPRKVRRLGRDLPGWDICGSRIVAALPIRTASPIPMGLVWP